MKRWPTLPHVLLFALLPLCASARTIENHAQWNAEIAAFEAADRANPPPAGPNPSRSARRFQGV